MEEHGVPAVGSVWVPDSVSIYTIICVANVSSEVSRVDFPAGHTINANDNVPVNRFQEFPDLVAVVDANGRVTALTYEEMYNGVNQNNLEPWVIYSDEYDTVWAQRPEDFHRSRKPHTA